MRGKRLLCEPFKAEARITPADAGKTFMGIHVVMGYQDHPRGCGENSHSADAVLRMPGSPPRMRGKRIAAINPSTTPRITPADAGKTTPPQCRPVHNPGSPPRMRGKHRVSRNIATAIRITPADAGKTRKHRACQRGFEDHPRGCGENKGYTSAAAPGPGSPPRMRGKPM